MQDRVDRTVILPQVYISHPITQGDVFANIRMALAVKETIMRYGYAAPICPAQVDTNLRSGFTHEQWLDHDLPIVHNSHAVVTLIDGPSEGRDLENYMAMYRSNIPVFNWLEDDAALKSWCVAWIENNNPVEIFKRWRKDVLIGRTVGTQ